MMGCSLRACAALALMIAACDVHDGLFNDDEDFDAGGADPYNFPPPYRGVGQIRQVAASGVFTEVGAYARGRPIGYFQFPFSPSQLQTTNYSAPTATAWPDGVIDPLRVSGPGTDFRQQLNNPVPVPMVYNFDPPGGDDPFATEVKCAAPEGYVPNVFYDRYPQDVQWNIFTFLPDRFTTFGFGTLPTWSYRPVVAEVSVGTRDMVCQTVKSERTLLSLADDGKLDVKRGDPEADTRLGRLGAPNPGRFLAWAIIDPGSAVVRVGQKPDVLQGGKVTGVSVQKYGWYGQFILAYIDGGYIPIEDGARVAGAPTQRMRAQRLYYPRSDVIRNGATSSSPGTMGQGYDVLQGDRFLQNTGYSPVCEVWTYALPQATAEADLPKDEASIIAQANSTLEPARQPQSASAFTPSPTVIPRYVFCLQAAPR
jgi:hypothetical protein